jgi:hypothetical protein
MSGIVIDQIPFCRLVKPSSVATSADTQLSELACKFESDCAFVSCLSTNTTPKGAWYLDSGASHHMTKDRELFNILLEDGSDLDIELGNETKYPVWGQRIVQFQLELEGFFDAHEVLYVPGLKNLLSISAMEDKGYEVNFRRGQIFIRPEGANPDTVVRIGV